MRSVGTSRLKCQRTSAGLDRLTYRSLATCAANFCRELARFLARIGEDLAGRRKSLAVERRGGGRSSLPDYESCRLRLLRLVGARGLPTARRSAIMAGTESLRVMGERQGCT